MIVQQIDCFCFYLEYLFDTKQRTIKKSQEFVELTHSVDFYYRPLKIFTEWLVECERYLSSQRPVQHRLALCQTLLKQIDDHQLFQNQLKTYKERFIDLHKLAIHLKCLLPKTDSIYIRNSLVPIQTRWHKVRIRTNEKMKELEKAAQETRKVINRFRKKDETVFHVIK